LEASGRADGSEMIFESKKLSHNAYARGVFNEAVERSASALREAAESYRALLNEYLKKLNQTL